MSKPGDCCPYGQNRLTGPVDTRNRHTNQHGLVRPRQDSARDDIRDLRRSRTTWLNMAYRRSTGLGRGRPS